MNWTLTKPQRVTLGFVGVVVVLLLVVRQIGLPWYPEPTTIHGGIVLRFIGYRTHEYYTNGVLMATELWRGSATEAGANGSILEIPLVSGDYHDWQGHKLSSIRRGSGVRILFHDICVPRLMASYRDGRACGPFLTWYPDGQLQFQGHCDTEGLLHGRGVRFGKNGQKIRERLYTHGE